MFDRAVNFPMKDGANNLITVALAVAGGVGWLILLIDRVRYRRRDVRLHVYQDTLSKLDEINERLTTDYSGPFLQRQSELFSSIVTDPADFENVYARFVQETYQEMIRIVALINATFSELNQLRLVASTPTLELLNRYRELSLRQAQNFSEMMDQFKKGNVTGGNLIDNDLQISGPAQNLAEEIRDTRQALERQMRADIGYSK